MQNERPHQPRQTFGTPDQIVARIAARQHGTIRLAQLLWAGLSPDAISRRVRDGRLHKLYRGVYAVGHVGLSEKGRMLAAAHACGEGAAIGYLHAAYLEDVSRVAPPLSHRCRCPS